MYRRSTVILAASAAALWSTALVLVLLQIKRITPQPLALLCAVMAAAASVIAWVSLQHTPAPVVDPWTPSARLSTVIESRWTPELAGRTTLSRLPTRVMSQPVPVPVQTTSGESTRPSSPRRAAVSDEMLMSVWNLARRVGQNDRLPAQDHEPCVSRDLDMARYAALPPVANSGENPLFSGNI